MADENIVTNIVAKSDFSNLIADLNKVSSALIKLQDQLQSTNKTLAVQADAINRNFASTLRSTGQFSTHFVSLSSDVDKFGMQLEKGQIKLRQFFRVYAEHSKTTGGLIRDLAKQQVQLQNAVLQPLGRNAEGLMQYNVNIPRGLDLIKNKTAIAKQELQIMNRVVQEGANQLINWGKNTQWAGRQLTVGLTVPLAAFGKAAADAFRTADEQLVRLTKVYGGIAPTASADLIKVRKDVVDTAKEISKSMGASFNETIGLAADIAATGKTGNELLGSIKETTRLAVLGEVDRQEAMKATLAIQSAFNANTEELANTINFLNAVENQTSTTLSDLVEAIPKAGPVVKGLGGDVKDLALYLTAMREGGINASEAANALKSSLASLINPTKVATGMFADFGIDLKGIVTQNAGNLTKTILTLQSALDTLNPLQKQQALEQLFGKFQFARINALFENLGRQGSQTLQVLDLMKASSSDLANIAGRELTQVTESASGRYRRAIEGLKADLAGIGDQFLNINTHLINFIDGILKFVQALPKPIRSVLSFMGMLVATAGPIIMLTGVLGNFFGYVIKGASHFRSLFKGGEGWKLLTPEILAAQKAGNLVEQTFYSDAQAAAVLKTAIQNLAAEYQVLATASQKAAVSTNPTVSTTGGTMIIPGRVVNPQNKFAGEYGTRAATHMNPVAGMTAGEKTAQTIFGVVPGPIPVNRRIGANPQIMATGELPAIPGLTQISGVSTGVVASEAAKWHSMTGMLSMLSKREVKALKKEITLTGTMSQEFIQTYSTLHPVISQITQNAAKESQLILAQLQAGKLTVDQARAQIIAVNAQMEAMMVQSTQQVAQSLGRTAQLTSVPLINQPIVSAAGKSNIKELFRKGRPVSGIIDKIARVLGVRTYGAGYSTETTIPKKFATGNIVPGTGNSDTVPAMLTPGEFVVNKEATQANLPLLSAINNGGQVRFERGHVGPQISGQGLNISNLYSGSRGTSYVAQGIPIWMTSNLNQATRSTRAGLTGRQVHGEFMTSLRNGRHPFEPLITAARSAGMPQEEAKIIAAFNEMMNDLSGRNADSKFIGGTPNSFENYFTKKVLPKFGTDFQRLFMSFGTAYGQRGSRSGTVAQGNVHIDEKTGTISGIRGRGNPLARGISSSIIGSSGGGGTLGITRSRLASQLASVALSVLSRGKVRPSSGIIRMNQGGMVPGTNIRGYGFGGRVGQIAGFAAPLIAPAIGEKIGSAVGGESGASTGRTVGNIVSWGLVAKSLLGIGKAAEESGGKIGLLRKALSMPFIPPQARVPLAIITAIAVGAKTLNSHLEKTGQLNRLAFAGGVKPLEDFNSKIKEVKKSIEDARAARELLNAQFTSAGLPGLALTAEQFGKLKDEVAKTYPELVKLIKATDQSKLRDVARGLKAQFVAAGDSAAQANAKIAALLQLGEKGGFLSAVLGSEGVKGITDAKSAIDSMLGALNPKGDVGQFAESILQIFTSSDEYISKQKDSGNAVKDILEQINKSSSKNVTLTDNQISKLKDLSPELAKVLKNTDTVGTAFAKWRIVLSGVTKDLSNLTNDQLNTLAEYATKISGYFDKIKDVSSKEAQSNVATGEMAKAIDKFNKQQSAASSSVLQNLDDQISSKKALIDLIKKEAEERKKALRDQQSAEDTKLQIQKEQLAYQDALATGDMSAAAQAQINIQRLVGASQLQAAEKAIDEDAQRRIDQLQNAINSLSNRAGKIQSSTASQTPKTSPLQSIYDRLTAFLKDVALNNPQGNFTEEQLTTFNSYLTELSRIPGGQKYIDQLSSSGPVSMVTDRSERANDTRTLTGTSQGAALGYDLQKAISSNQVAAGMGPTNKILTDILNAISKNPEAMAATSIRVNSMRGGSNYVADYTLKNAGVEVKQGVTFKDKSGKTWKIDSIDSSGKVIVSEYNTTQNTPKTRNAGAGGKYMGGYIRHYGPGGGVFGPGTGTSDSIPAYLSNGEYVVRAASVSKVGVPFLDNINKMADGGLARYNIPSSKSYGMLGFNRGGRINNYNVGGLTMHFENGGEVDGRMLFEQFKQAMKEDQLRSGRTIYVGGAA